MSNKNTLRLGDSLLRRLPCALFVWLLCALFFIALDAGPVLSATSSEEALLRSEERRRAIAQRMENSTVFIIVTKDDELQGLGSGFVVADGYVMTNGHVTDAGDTWYVAGEGLPPVKARLIKSEYDSGVADYALLRFSSNASPPPLTFNTLAGRMDRVSAWGYPYLVTQFDQNMSAIEEGNFEGLPPLVYTEGVISTIVRSGKAKNIIHTASIASGNSGGPLINSWGEVVGINTWGYTEEGEGAFVNAALPADKVVDFLRSCGIQPLLSQRSSSHLQAALAPQTPGHAAPPAESALPFTQKEQQKQGRDSSPFKGTRGATDTGTASELPPGLSESLQKVWHDASRGEAISQAAMGLAYYTGDGAPKDIATAMTWLQKAHAQDDNEATYLLGIIYVTDIEHSDVPKGMKLLRKAADTDADYASTVAVLLLDGENLGVERDTKLSATYAVRGTEARDTDAVAVLAFLTYFGMGGLEADNAKALQLAQSAAKEENALALTVLGWMSYMGDAMPLDIKRALSYATDAAESDEAHAMGLLAFMYYVGDDDLKPDMKKAEGWAVRAAEQCNAYGQYVLGMLYKEKKTEQKQVEAWAYLDMAARYLVVAEKQRDTLSKKLKSAQLNSAKALSAKWLAKFGLPPNS